MWFVNGEWNDSTWEAGDFTLRFGNVFGLAEWDSNPTLVPEPSTLTLFATGLAWLGFMGWRRRQSRELPQLTDHVGQRRPVHELHSIVVHAAFTADGVDWKDIVLMKLSRSLGFVLESLELAGVEHGGKGQHLQRDTPIEGDLLGLIDHAHAPAADLAEDTEVPKGAGCGRLGGVEVEGVSLSRADQVEAVEALGQLGGQVGVRGEELGTVERGAGLAGGEVLVDEPSELELALGSGGRDIMHRGPRFES